MPAGGISIWFATWLTALSAGLGRIVAVIPNLIGAIVILLIGWGIGKLVQALVTRVLEAMHFDRVTERAGINDTLKRADIKYDSSQILGIVAYWFVFLIAIQAAANALGIVALSTLMATIILYIPRVFAALLIVIAGAWVASFLGQITRASAAEAKITYSDLLGNIVQGFMLFFSFAIALDFLGLSFPFMTTAFAILLGSIALAGAIAFGLGGREYAADVLAGRELRALFHSGDRLATDEVDGTVQNIGPTFTTVRTTKGDITVQNSTLMQKRVIRPSQGTGGEGGGMSKAA